MRAVARKYPDKKLLYFTFTPDDFEKPITQSKKIMELLAELDFQDFDNVQALSFSFKSPDP